MDEKLKALVTDIRRLYHGAKIFLFGSRARGNYGEQSDYDLIIVSPKFAKTDFLDRTGTIWRNSDVIIAADIFCYTPKEFLRISKTSVVIKDAMQHAVPL